MKTFPDMTFDERVAWARGHILVAVGEGRFGDAVWAVCHQFTLWPRPANRKEAKAMAQIRGPQGPKVRKPQGTKKPKPKKGAR